MLPQASSKPEINVFDARTTAELAGVLEVFASPCLLCLPRVGRALLDMGRQVTVLDTDPSFAHLPGFAAWDLRRPVFLEGAFDAVMCDPPLGGLSLTQLLSAVQVLVQTGGPTSVAIAYPQAREEALLRVFSPLGLAATGYFPRYASDSGPTGVQFYANFEAPLWNAQAASWN